MGVATREEVEGFLADHSFTGYSSVPLPHGLEVPGRSKQPSADVIFRHGVEGRSVLELGTFYGFYPLEATRRGAARAVGVEMDPGRFAIADKICALHGRPYEVLLGRAEDMEFNEQFDQVLLLNVLHHVLDPIEAVRKVASLSRDRVTLEFSMPSEPGLLNFVDRDEGDPSLWERVRSRAYSAALRALPSSLPLMAVGNRAYHTTWYFTPRAFRNLFVRHLQIFEHVEFLPGVTGGHRRIADCRVAR